MAADAEKAKEAKESGCTVTEIKDEENKDTKPESKVQKPPPQVNPQ